VPCSHPHSSHSPGKGVTSICCPADEHVPTCCRAGSTCLTVLDVCAAWEAYTSGVLHGIVMQRMVHWLHSTSPLPHAIVVTCSWYLALATCQGTAVTTPSNGTHVPDSMQEYHAGSDAGSDHITHVCIKAGFAEVGVQGGAKGGAILQGRHTHNCTLLASSSYLVHICRLVQEWFAQYMPESPPGGRKESSQSSMRCCSSNTRSIR
jgi:hypothetical protein